MSQNLSGLQKQTCISHSLVCSLTIEGLLEAESKMHMCSICLSFQACRSTDSLEHTFLTTEAGSARGQAILILEAPFEWEGCPVYFIGQSK